MSAAPFEGEAGNGPTGPLPAAGGGRSVSGSRTEDEGSMALYEITMLRLNGQTETRYTDWPPAVGDTLPINGRPMKVVACDDQMQNPAATARFVCQECAALDSAA